MMGPEEVGVALFNLQRAIDKQLTINPNSSLAICANPQTIEMLREKIQTIPGTGIKRLYGLAIYEFEEIPTGNVIVQPLNSVPDRLADRLPWIEGLCNG